MRRNRIGDITILLISVAVIIVSLGSYGQYGGKPEVHVRVGSQEWVYDLAVDTFATFNGPVGETSIVVSNGEVHVHDSDCRNKVCISAGTINRVGQWIICLPNNVFIMIEGKIGKEEGDVDETAF